MANISDVAKRAGVSAATVSRALQDDARVTDATKERVRTAAAELNYRPNRIARSLRTQRSETIGVVVSDIENPHFTRMVRVIESAAFDAGFRVMLCNTDETAFKQRTYLEVLAAEQSRGVILVPNDPSDPTIDSLVCTGIPIVAFDREVDHPDVDAVLPDNHRAVTNAVDHLIERGCRKIAGITGRANIQSGWERQEAYMAAMKQAGMDTIFADGGFREQEAFEATLGLLETLPDIDGLLVSNNMMTIGALKAIKQLGLHAGDDVCVVAFDDPTWASLLDPSVTSVRQPVDEMAREAFALLTLRMDGETGPGRKSVFPCSLIVRQSSERFHR